VINFSKNERGLAMKYQHDTRIQESGYLRRMGYVPLRSVSNSAGDVISLQTLWQHQSGRRALSAKDNFICEGEPGFARAFQEFESK